MPMRNDAPETVAAANEMGRRDALVALSRKLAAAIDACDDEKALPVIARQYRETLKDLDAVQPEGESGLDALLGDTAKVRDGRLRSLTA